MQICSEVLLQNTNWITEFLHQLNIVKYPPPLYCFAWKDLNESEQKATLKELQRIDKENLHRASEARSGKFLAKFGDGRNKNDPNEWRSWYKMAVWERVDAYEKLQVFGNALEKLLIIANGEAEKEKGIRARRGSERV